MKKSPSISVVIPHYNKESYIALALNSVLNQTFQDFEVIVVDDGPTDKCAKIIERLGDPRIRFIQGMRQGVSAARNLGIEEARADLVAFLDADDEWLPDFIKTILNLRTMYPDAGLYGTAYEAHFPGTVVQRVYNNNEGNRLLVSYFGALVNFGSVIFYPSNSAAPKKVLMRIGGFPFGVKWGEDGALWGKIALQYPVAYCPKVCSIYRKYTENSSAGITEYHENPFIKYLSEIPKNELSSFHNFKDLMEYTDLCRLSVISRNIYSGYGVRARSELMFVKSTRYKWKKNKMKVLSYIPPRFISIIRNHAKELSYAKRKIIRKNF